MEQFSPDQNMKASGVDTEDSLFEDYFGFDRAEQFFLPDGKQYIEFKVMTEGARTRYQQATNRDITLQRTTGDAKMKVDPATDRRELLVNSVSGWYLVKYNPNKGARANLEAWESEAFSIGSKGSTFEQWLEKANPSIVDELEKAIRKANRWMLAEMTSDDIEKEIENLREMKVEALKRERGEGVSSSR
jgi:hypothetical protein